MQLETEVFKREQMQALNERIHTQFMELQKQVADGVRIPEGYSLVETEIFERFMNQ